MDATSEIQLRLQRLSIDADRLVLPDRVVARYTAYTFRVTVTKSPFTSVACGPMHGRTIIRKSLHDQH
ncbi:hypothetical protein FHX09_001052 [Rhizobium sp. BK538]|nr:hypothetical protein [Rhizobium sp. BK060]MBB4167228.1 hypothetical protein [Rhizobium sp. BK538]TCM78010.1 hypothetical protein EV291_106179 [Rhizobium sp. BK068]